MLLSLACRGEKRSIANAAKSISRMIALKESDLAFDKAMDIKKQAFIQLETQEENT